MNEGQHIKRIERLIRNNEAVILNSGFEVISVSHWHRAIELALSDNAQIVVGRTDGALVRSQFLTLPRPLIIALNKYVGSYRPSVSEDCIVSKKTIFARDEYSCVYCGKSSGKMTIDHVTPRSKGGDDSWGNMVSSCSPCNALKADKSLKEVGFEEPIIPPVENRNMRFAMVDNAVRKYLTEEYAQDYGAVDAGAYMNA